MLSEDDDIIHNPDSDEEVILENNFNSNGLFLNKKEILEETALNRFDTVGDPKLDSLLNEFRKLDCTLPDD